MTFVFKRNRFRPFICASLFLLVSHLSSTAQVPSVTTYQDISFGAFFQGSSGGTVTISPDGTRLVSGDIIEANISGFSHFPAIFDIVTDPDVLISILKGSDTTLSGSNGGFISIQVGDSDTSFPIIVPPSGSLRVSLGGILTVGNSQANPSGDYTGSFEVTFIQE